MSVFVILSLAVAVMVAAVLVLAGIQLGRAVGRLTRVAGDVQERLAPLTQELQDELAVTTTESAALQQTVEAWQRERQTRRRDKEGLRKGLRRTVRGG